MDRRIARGEVWTVAGGADYAGKPRPGVVVQDDRFVETKSVTICLLTTDTADVPLVRPEILPDENNGLRAPCRLMIDKLSTVPRTKLGRRIGKLNPTDLGELSRSLFVFLGLG